MPDNDDTAIRLEIEKRFGVELSLQDRFVTVYKLMKICGRTDSDLEVRSLWAHNATRDVESWNGFIRALAAEAEVEQRKRQLLDP